MEVELKYNIESRAQMDVVWNDEYLKSMEESDSRSTIRMKAAYFDTKDFALSNNFIAFRIRKEGDRIVGTLKWGDDNDVTETGLYIREEINVPIKDEACFLSPDPAIFRESEDGKKLLKLINGEPLICIFETHVERRALRIDSGGTICEISFDEGSISAKDASMPISELEIELYSGSRDEMIRIGKTLVEKYDLKPELRSKYARGRLLVEQVFLGKR
jgi:inorganic triphosphatase YgiF